MPDKAFFHSRSGLTSRKNNAVRRKKNRKSPKLISRLHDLTHSDLRDEFGCVFIATHKILMNAFIKEIAILTGLPMDTVFASYRYVNLSGRAVYIQGHKGFTVISEEAMALKVPGRKKLTVTGKGMCVQYLSGDDAVIAGEIGSVVEE